MTNAPTLARAVWPVAEGTRTAVAAMRIAIYTAIGVVLLSLSAKAQVPFWPVPVTLQTLVVFAVALAYGSRLGAATLASYLAVGAAGLPVFARGGGIGYFVTQPSAGYLVGFLVAAFVVGLLAERRWDRRPLLTIAALVLGNVIVYMIGATWLATYIGLAKTWAAGVAPFLLGDALKIGILAALMPMAWRALAAIRS
jgi:biotin transport system substrate-specific component